MTRFYDASLGAVDKQVAHDLIDGGYMKALMMMPHDTPAGYVDVDHVDTLIAALNAQLAGNNRRVEQWDNVATVSGSEIAIQQYGEDEYYIYGLGIPKPLILGKEDLRVLFAILNSMSLVDYNLIPKE
jgi:hypothetical protein